MKDFKRFLYIVTSLFTTMAVKGQADDVRAAMEKHKVVPDVLSQAPNDMLEVHYDSGSVKLGNVLTPQEVAKEPKLFWNADSESFYTACMCDPDAPSRSNPKAREWKHWLVGNIPESNIKKGTQICAYAGSTPPKGTGPHRYVFVVYKQPGKLNFDEPKTAQNSGDNRAKFSISKFAEKYKLGNPVAGNFFLAEWSG